MSGTLQTTIPSYLYTQYADDDDLQAFVAAFNGLSQQYLNTFNALGLPVYTGSLIAGALLDWVSRGLYGYARPALPSGTSRTIGPLNTYGPNVLALNASVIIGPIDYTATSDDTLKRLLTWHFFKGDGKVFNIRWLKRRIMRLLTGDGGTSPNIDATYQISVTFGVGNQVNIRILARIVTVTGGAMPNRFGCNAPVPLNTITTVVMQLAPPAEGAILQAAITSGAAELPFQFDWVVDIA